MANFLKNMAGLGLGLGKKHALGLGMMGGGAIINSISNRNARNNGRGFGNGLGTTVGLGMMGFGGYKLGLHRQLTSAGRRHTSKVLTGYSSAMTTLGHNRMAGIYSGMSKGWKASSMSMAARKRYLGMRK